MPNFGTFLKLTGLFLYQENPSLKLKNHPQLLRTSANIRRELYTINNIYALNNLVAMQK